MSPIDPYRTALPCNPPCARRLIAAFEEKFLPAKTLGGWVWLDAPLRQLSLTNDAKWRVLYYGHDVPDHSREPYVWTHTCPFCGGDLPAPKSDDWCLDGEIGG